jgi:type II secretory pathway component PulC
VTPAPEKAVEPVPVAPRPKVTEVKVPERKTARPPKKISRQRKFAPKAGVSSTRQKTSIILFIVLTAALIIVLARPYLASRRKSAGSRTVEETISSNSTRADIKIDWPVPPVYSVELRDPMQLGPRQKIIVKKTNDLVVRGISHSEDRKYAVIGTQTVQEGDVIQGATIVEINPNNVVFERDGKRWPQEVQGEE